MNYPRSSRISNRILIASAIAGVFLAAALFVGSAPKSSAAKLVAPAARDTSQQNPDLTFVASYEQTNLVSDLPGYALVEDPFLVNPWGIALAADNPFWVVNNGDPEVINSSAYGTLYKGDVAGSPLVRNPDPGIVGITGPPSIQPLRPAPSAIASTYDFGVSGADLPPPPAQFIIASEIGAISAWQPFNGSQSVVAKVLSGHQHTGLANGNNGSANLLYLADFANGNIDVLDTTFNPTSVPGNFTDATIPPSFHPYNIQNLGGSLYVTYADFNVHCKCPNNGSGYVRKFNTAGVRDTGFAINLGPLSAPWGLAIAPPGGVGFSGRLLVGNYGQGGASFPSINAFDPATGALFGHMVDGGGADINIEKLRTLIFGNGINGGDPGTLYFSAGAFGEHHGLFGSLKPISGIPSSTIQFSNMNWNNQDYFVHENDGHIDITVTRTGNTAGTATVNYATVNGSASQAAQYEIALGKITFGPGETSKTFRVLVIDNHLIAGGTPSILNLGLSNATGAALATPNRVQLLIFDDEFDTPRDPANTSDDQPLFVRQQYFDFLNREPDTSGFNFWLNQITSCGNDTQCVELKRTNVSAAFFLSIEFQKTGIAAYLTSKLTGSANTYGQFMRDLQMLQKDFVVGAPGADAQLETNKQLFFNDVVSRPEFVVRFAGMSNAQYVDTLLQNRETGSSSAERDPLVAGLNNGTETRATVLRKIGEFPAFRTQELNRAFVTMEYFGYLRRDPDAPGFNFWLNKLNSFNGDFVRSDMVKAFLKSTEYRRRFGPP